MYYKMYNFETFQFVKGISTQIYMQPNYMKLMTLTVQKGLVLFFSMILLIMLTPKGLSPQKGTMLFSFLNTIFHFNKFSSFLS